MSWRPGVAFRLLLPNRRSGVASRAKGTACRPCRASDPEVDGYPGRRFALPWANEFTALQAEDGDMAFTQMNHRSRPAFRSLLRPCGFAFTKAGRFPHATCEALSARRTSALPLDCGHMSLPMPLWLRLRRAVPWRLCVYFPVMVLFLLRQSTDAGSDDGRRPERRRTRAAKKEEKSSANPSKKTKPEMNPFLTASFASVPFHR